MASDSSTAIAERPLPSKPSVMNPLPAPTSAAVLPDSTPATAKAYSLNDSEKKPALISSHRFATLSEYSLLPTSDQDTDIAT